MNANLKCKLNLDVLEAREMPAVVYLPGRDYANILLPALQKGEVVRLPAVQLTDKVGFAIPPFAIPGGIRVG